MAYTEKFQHLADIAMREVVSVSPEQVNNLLAQGAVALDIRAKAVQIEQLGGGLWIRPQPEPDQDMGVWLQGFYASTEALPTDFLAAREDPPAQERDWSLS